ncbi:protein of unknown function [Flexibacter flexilis DSM 6793]|uniref:DUF4834 domain-containing protein n=1 Tax=Flexibacter flexilis DSM 6793 TaxID=927664 RepID=A0A1I1NLS0_9BACT|nr:DUF4834 family protein [Flexibacter flexilis]SFC98405.1 protein of unknown function [Flexibacter flexilis DSM 6793]
MLGIIKFVIYFFFFYALYKIFGLVVKAFIRRWILGKMAEGGGSRSFYYSNTRTGQNKQEPPRQKEGEVRIESDQDRTQRNFEAGEYIDYEEIK